MFVSQQVCTDLRRDFGPLHFADPLLSKGSEAVIWQLEASAPSADF